MIPLIFIHIFDQYHQLNILLTPSSTHHLIILAAEEERKRLEEEEIQKNKELKKKKFLEDSDSDDDDDDDDDDDLDGAEGEGETLEGGSLAKIEGGNSGGSVANGSIAAGSLTNGPIVDLEAPFPPDKEIKNIEDDTPKTRSNAVSEKDPKDVKGKSKIKSSKIAVISDDKEGDIEKGPP